MKKLLPLTILIFFPFFAYATSGACSGHGGVDCSAGAGAYGQVICNDGWDESSVSYASMEECQIPSPPATTVTNTCTPPVLTGCTVESEYTQLQSLCAEGQTQSYLLSFCAKAATCESQITAYNAAEQTYNTCIANYTQQVEQAGNAQIQQSEDQLQQSTNELQQLKLDASCGVNETYDQSTDQCECTAGDTYLDNECMTPDEVQEVQAMDVTVAAQVQQESTATAPQPGPIVVSPPSQNQNAPVTPHKTSAITKLVSEAQVQATTSTPAASTTPPQPVVQDPIPTHTSFIHKIYSFFANLLGF